MKPSDRLLHHVGMAVLYIDKANGEMIPAWVREAIRMDVTAIEKGIDSQSDQPRQGLIIANEGSLPEAKIKELEALGFTVVTKTHGHDCQVIFLPRPSATILK